MATANVGNESTNHDKQPSVFCETCEYKRTAKYCISCELSFCVTCIRVHQKMKGSQDHVVREISEQESTNEGKQLEPQLPCCFDHPGNDYTQFCTDCTCLICERCKPAHHGHTLEVITKDFGFYRNVCRKNTQRLLDTAHELEDYKSLLDRNVKNCDEAIANVEKVEFELIALIKKCAKQLKESLLKVKGDHQKRAAKQMFNIDDTLNEIDDQVANLNTRKLADQHILAHETASSQALISKVSNVVDTLPPQPNVIPVSDLAPGSSEMENLICGITKLFDVTDITLITTSKNVTLINEFEIPNPKYHSTWGYRICKPSTPGCVIMYGTAMSNIRILDRTNNTILGDRSDRHAWNMIALAPQKYVSIHGFTKTLFVMGKDFQSIGTREIKGDFYFDALYPIQSDRFLVYEVKESFPRKGILKIMGLNGNRMYFESQFQINFGAARSSTRLALLTDHMHALICSGNQLCKVNITNGSSQKYDLSTCANSTVDATCVTSDSNDNILVGCRNGVIHQFDKHVQIHKMYLKMDTQPGDIEVIGNRLFVTMSNKLHEYTYI